MVQVSFEILSFVLRCQNMRLSILRRAYHRYTVDTLVVSDEAGTTAQSERIVRGQSRRSVGHFHEFWMPWRMLLILEVLVH